MRREYKSWKSNNMEKNMEMLIFGDFGTPYLVFPTAKGRFFDWEDHGMITGLEHKLAQGHIKLYLVDGVDDETWYAFHKPPHERLKQHLCWENYIINEVLPFICEDCCKKGMQVGVTGADFGAYHAVNFFFKHPDCFCKLLSLSGVYDIRFLFSGYHDLDIYYNNPAEFIPNLQDEHILKEIKAAESLKLVAGQGAWEDNALSSTKHLCQILSDKQIAHECLIWGHEVDHHWYWWRKQVEMYLD